MQFCCFIENKNNTFNKEQWKTMFHYTVYPTWSHNVLIKLSVQISVLFISWKNIFLQVEHIFILSMKEYLFVNQTHFHSFHIVKPYTFLKNGIQRCKDKQKWNNKQQQTNERLSNLSKFIFVDYYITFIWYFFQWTDSNACDHNLWNLVAIKKYKNGRLGRTPPSQFHVFF